jgi:hypothetical protein
MTDQNTGKSSAGKKRTEGGIPYKERERLAASKIIRMIVYIAAIIK